MALTWPDYAVLAVSLALLLGIGVYFTRAQHDTVDFFDWGKAVRASFPELKPSTATISLRLPASMLEELKALANERDVPYQSLLKVFLAERIANERGMRRKVPV